MPTIIHFGGSDGISADDYNSLNDKYNALTNTYNSYVATHSYTNDQYNALSNSTKYNPATLKTGTLSASNISGNGGSGLTGPSATWTFKFADNIIPVSVKISFASVYPSQAFSLNFNGKEIYYQQGDDIGAIGGYYNTGYAIVSTLTGITTQAGLEGLAGGTFTFYNKGGLNRPCTVTCVEWFEKQ